MAPLIKEFQKHPDIFKVQICLTGQHREMLDQINAFFGIAADYDLNLMSPDQTLFDITARCLTGLKDVLEKSSPDLVFVQGDTSSVMAGALAVFYKQIPVAHLEASLRSGEKYSPFPEEINRIITGHFATTIGAARLKSKGLKGFSISALKNHRAFYLTYPQIRQSVIGELRAGNHRAFLRTLPELEKGLMPAGSSDPETLSPQTLLTCLTYTHFIELFRVSDPTQRLFYEVETIKNNWSVRELKRAVDTSLAFRTALSTDKKSIIAKIKNAKPGTNAESIRDPYVLEFLGLEEKSEYTESDLEQSILNNLQRFLIELGTGFCFEARQKRITFNNKHYRVDLVFYHRVLKCHVLIDLKIGEFDHAAAGQMNLYLNYFKDNEMSEGDNPPVGIILCADKDDMLVKYSTDGMADQMFVSKYLLKLPKKRVLEEFLKREMGQE